MTSTLSAATTAHRAHRLGGAVSAPLYALVFLGQVASGWTISGRIRIVAAGILVVLYARGGSGLEPLG
jgi:hypothetical protein